METLVTGDTLPNGAKVLDFNPKTKKVLALRVGTTQPYVIWSIGDDLTCYWGHYFYDGVTAMNQWIELESSEEYTN